METARTESPKLPGAIGGAVYAYYAEQFLSRLALPDHERPEDVLDVAHTVMNHTGIHPVQLIGHLPAIKELMAELQEIYR